MKNRSIKFIFTVGMLTLFVACNKADDKIVAIGSDIFFKNYLKTACGDDYLECQKATEMQYDGCKGKYLKEWKLYIDNLVTKAENKIYTKENVAGNAFLMKLAGCVVDGDGNPYLGAAN